MTTTTIQQDINPRVQLNVDSGLIFLRVWSQPTRRGRWLDMEIEDNQIPFMAQLYLSVPERKEILNLIK